MLNIDQVGKSHRGGAGQCERKRGGRKLGAIEMEADKMRIRDGDLKACVQVSEGQSEQWNIRGEYWQGENGNLHNCYTRRST